MLKQSVLLIWIGSLAGMLLGSGGVARVAGWVFGLTLVAHVVEFFVNLPLFRRAGGSLGHHFVQTLIYGLFHWTPIRQRLEAGESG